MVRCSLAPRTRSDRHVRAARYGTISTPAVSLSAAPSVIDVTALPGRRVSDCSTRTKTRTNLLPIIAVASSSVGCFARSVTRIQAGDFGRARGLSIESPSPRKSRCKTRIDFGISDFTGDKFKIGHKPCRLLSLIRCLPIVMGGAALPAHTCSCLGLELGNLDIQLHKRRK